MGRNNLDPERRYGWSIEEVFAETTHYNSRTMSARDRNGTDITLPAHTALGVGDPIEPLMNFANHGSLKPVWTHNDAYEFLMKDAAQRSGQNHRVYSNHMFKARHDFHLQNNAGGRTDGGFRGDSYNEVTDQEGSRIMHDAEGKKLPECNPRVVQPRIERRQLHRNNYLDYYVLAQCNHP